jgi:sulfur carrier protein
MRIVLNGKQVELEPAANVTDVVAAAGADPDARGVAVAIEGEVVVRGEWGERELREGESVEVVHAVQGG